MATRDGRAIDDAPVRVRADTYDTTLPIARVVAMRNALASYAKARAAHDADVTNQAKLHAKVAAAKDLARARDALDAALLGGA